MLLRMSMVGSRQTQTWFEGMKEAYDGITPLTFEYIQVVGDDLTVRQQGNASCVGAVFFFQTEKIIYHFYGIRHKDDDGKMMAVHQNGVLVPQTRDGDDCYVMLRNQANNTNVLTICVLDWEIDGSFLVTASKQNRSLSVLTNRYENIGPVIKRFSGIQWDTPIVTTDQKNCAGRIPQ